MGRLFSAFVLCALLLPAPAPHSWAQPVFFSLLFPQLIPERLLESGTGREVEL
ncbi:MAG: hypothetical protein IJB85_12230 [Clostridia bacterium]|nr:hypothetical protein [Clostridia bacterium]